MRVSRAPAAVSESDVRRKGPKLGPVVISLSLIGYFEFVANFCDSECRSDPDIHESLRQCEILSMGCRTSTFGRQSNRVARFENTYEMSTDSAAKKIQVQGLPWDSALGWGDSSCVL